MDILLGYAVFSMSADIRAHRAPVRVPQALEVKRPDVSAERLDARVAHLRRFQKRLRYDWRRERGKKIRKGIGSKTGDVSFPVA